MAVIPKSASSRDWNLSRVAKALKISRPLALKLIKQDGLPSHASRSGIRVNPMELNAWIERRRVGSSLANPSGNE